MEKVKAVTLCASLSSLEMSLIADSLSTAAAEFEDRSCNDFTLPITPGNRAIAEAVVRSRDASEFNPGDTADSFVATMNAREKDLAIYDNWAASYFAVRCKRLTGAPAHKLSADELTIIDELLQSSAEDHESWYEDEHDDLDITLSPSAEHRSLMAAVLEHQMPTGWKARLAKLQKATGPVSLPDFLVMRYLAARCKAHAALADTVFVANLPPESTEKSPDGVPAIARTGVAPRFPQIEPYLKAYSQSFQNWQSEELPLLERYGAGQVTEDFAAARRSLFNCSLALRWHAVQSALGGGITKSKEKKTKIPTREATHREFEKLIENGRHVHLSISPALNAQYFEEVAEPDFDREYAAKADGEISEAEFAIARHLLLHNHESEHVQQAFLASAPQLVARKGKDAAKYVADTMRRAAADPDLRKWREQNRSARVDAAAFQSATGKDWQTTLRRSVAYDYWSCRMAAHSGGPYDYWFDNIAVTAADCLVLGWEQQALNLFRQIHTHFQEGRFNHADDKSSPIQFFLIRLVYDWQGWPRRSDGEPLSAALIAHWRTPNPDALAPLLLAACDRHTHQAVKKTNSLGPGATYHPFEILAVLRLRLLHGLKNPVLEHPLMSTPLGALPQVTEPYTDDLLEKVIKQARLEFPDL